MIELSITETGKGHGSKGQYGIWSIHREHFQTITEAKSWLKDHYGNCKRVKMYQDSEDGQAKHIGYIYGFRNCDISHYPVEKWLQQDLVEFREVLSISPA
jgi:hypothetical protein|tara:strand:- start:13308 stop:13607 length:300 start_codon:yes stop_codon:yes gene_type:complete